VASSWQDWHQPRVPFPHYYSALMYKDFLSWFRLAKCSAPVGLRGFVLSGVVSFCQNARLISFTAPLKSHAFSILGSSCQNARTSAHPISACRAHRGTLSGAGHRMVGPLHIESMIIFLMVNKRKLASHSSRLKAVYRVSAVPGCAKVGPRPWLTWRKRQSNGELWPAWSKPCPV